MINKKILNNLKKNYLKDENNVLRNRVLNKSALIDLVTDNKDTLDVCFNIEVNTHKVTNQKLTGRCWSFAGLNILREDIINKCNLDYFELSENYIAFYDKLERFNLFLDRLEKYKNEGRNIYDRYVQDILKNGFDDGSNFFEFKSLVKKYGIVPKNVYSDSFNSNDTSELNDLLSILIRKYYLDSNDKEKYLENAYQLLCNIYGIPPEKFNFEYIDKDGNYNNIPSITPIDFYKTYTSTRFDEDYIEIYSFSDNKYSYNNTYSLEDNSLISGINKDKVLNLKYERVEELIIKQLMNNELVYFSSSTTTKYENGIWLDLAKRYSLLFNIDFNMKRNDVIKTYGTSNEHSMVITGVNIINDKINNWKIENSWGSKEGLSGYFIAEPEFVKKYLISVVINKKYLNKEELELLNNEPIIVSKWDYKFC